MFMRRGVGDSGSLTNFKFFGRFIGGFPCDDAASMAVKGLSSV